MSSAIERLGRRPLAGAALLAALVCGGCVERVTHEVAAVPALALVAVVPVGGHPSGGTGLTLSGAGFRPGCAVSIGGVPAEAVTVVSDALVTAIAPPGTAGAADVRVANPDGAAATLAGAWTYTTTPIVTAVTPASGDSTGGTVVTVSGAGFGSTANVTFGGGSAQYVRVLDSGRIVCHAPSGATGAVTVTVTDTAGWSGSRTGAFTYVTGGLLPSTSAVSPASGPAAGGTVLTVTGTNFEVGATVAIGGVAAATTRLDAGTLVVTTPPAIPGFGAARPVTVTNPSGGASINTSPGFTYVATLVEALSVTAFSPAVIAADAAGALHVAWDTPNGTSGYLLRYARSMDGGATWTSPATIGTSASPAPPTPRLAAGAGTVAAVWWKDGTTVTLTTSADGGANWSAASLSHVVEALALDPAGRLAMAYAAPDSTGQGPSGTTEIRVVSGPLGGPYATALNVSGPRWAHTPAVAAVATDRFCLAFIGGPNFTGIASDAWSSVSSDGGRTFATPLRVSNANPANNEAVATLTVAAGAGRAVLAWAYQVPTFWVTSPVPTQGTYCAGSANGGGAFGPAHQLSAWSLPPAAAVDGAGTIGVSWTQFTMAGTYDVLLFRSYDAGATVDGGILDYAYVGTSSSFPASHAMVPVAGRFLHLWLDADYTPGWQADVRGY